MCATIIDGTTQELTFNSEPAGATVTINGEKVGVTPISTEVARKDVSSVLFEKEGYKVANVELTKTMNGMFFGNIIIGGLPGSTTDAASGASQQYAPGSYSITLEKE